MNIEYKIATSEDAELIKKLINEMYGIEYEKRDNKEIAASIDNKTEIYILAYLDNNCVGFSGASLNNDYYADIITPDIAVLDYIYSKNISSSYELISKLLNALVKMGVKSAIMQVQTYNKQRFFHYALSDKNIIKSSPIESKGKLYEDQILKIEDLSKIASIPLRDLMQKAHNYKLEEK